MPAFFLRGNHCKTRLQRSFSQYSLWRPREIHANRRETHAVSAPPVAGISFAGNGEDGRLAAGIHGQIEGGFPAILQLHFGNHSVRVADRVFAGGSGEMNLGDMRRGVVAFKLEAHLRQVRLENDRLVNRLNR